MDPMAGPSIEFRRTRRTRRRARANRAASVRAIRGRNDQSSKGSILSTALPRPKSTRKNP